jgi:hypothetical protein
LIEEKLQIYRPKYPKQDENGIEWIPDWYLYKDYRGPILQCISKKLTSSFREVDIELEKVRELIAEIWKLKNPQIED